MVKAVSTQVMRESDAWTIANGTPSEELMARAARAIFEEGTWEPPVAVVCGKGNNAGDGYAAALLLDDIGIWCELILLEEKFSEDGAYYFQQCMEKEIPCMLWEEGIDLSGYGTILDCLLGTGFSGEVKEPMASLIRAVNESGAYVISADINSGLNGDTGEGDLFVKSDLTVSIGTYKLGHFCGRAKEAMKKKVNRDIGIEIRGQYVMMEE